jgi:hypothetical protein
MCPDTRFVYIQEGGHSALYTRACARGAAAGGVCARGPLRGPLPPQGGSQRREAGRVAYRRRQVC